jgi:sensory rhodopsin
MEHLKIAADNYVAFTFFIGTMAMMAASAFFFLELNNTDKKWRTSILVSGLITFIAAVHYYYMRGYNLETGDSPTFFRYVDWILTVPLMCVEFYLITKKAGAKISLLWKLIFASLVMLITGYVGEVLDPTQSVGSKCRSSSCKSNSYSCLVCISWLGNLPIGLYLGY